MEAVGIVSVIFRQSWVASKSGPAFALRASAGCRAGVRGGDCAEKHFAGPAKKMAPTMCGAGLIRRFVM